MLLDEYVNMYFYLIFVVMYASYSLTSLQKTQPYLTEATKITEIAAKYQYSFQSL